MPSHNELIKQGIQDYYETYDEWDLDGLIDEIINLSLLQGEISKLVLEMKKHVVEYYIEKTTLEPEPVKK